MQFALAQVGKPYVFGAAGPDSYDCSGLTMASWQRGRRQPAALGGRPVQLRPPRVLRPAAARRPDVLLPADRARHDLHRQRHDGVRAGTGRERSGRLDGLVRATTSPGPPGWSAEALTAPPTPSRRPAALAAGRRPSAARARSALAALLRRAAPGRRRRRRRTRRRCPMRAACSRRYAGAIVAARPAARCLADARSAVGRGFRAQQRGDFASLRRRAVAHVALRGSSA